MTRAGLKSVGRRVSHMVAVASIGEEKAEGSGSLYSFTFFNKLPLAHRERVGVTAIKSTSRS
jgi:hypothetical protein